LWILSLPSSVLDKLPASAFAMSLQLVDGEENDKTFYRRTRESLPRSKGSFLHRKSSGIVLKALDTREVN